MPEIDAALRAALAQGREAHPEVSVDAGAFARFLATRTGPASGLLSAHLDDLYLVCACLLGDGAALSGLEARVRAVVPPAVSRLRLSAATVEEVEQLVRERLLVAAPDGAPKLQSYHGRGSLKQWLRAVALRVALNLLEAQRPSELLEEGSLSAFAAPDPELALVKSRYRQEFKAAFQEALEGLSPRERTLLRLYFVQGLTVERIGRMEGSHKSTISRWLTRVRATLLGNVRGRLVERLRVAPDEFEGWMDLLDSQLELSLHRVLEPEEP